MSRRPATLASLAALILAIPASVRASPPPGALATCEQQLARAHDREEPARCFYELATGAGPFRLAAAQRLQKLIERYPENPWFPIYLGKVKGQAHDPEELKTAEALYALGARLAVQRGMAEAEFNARWGLCRILRNAGRFEEEEAEIERAVAAATASKLPTLRLRSQILRSLSWNARGEFEQAYVTLRRIQDDVEAQDSYDLHRAHLVPLASAAQETGRFQEALQTYGLAAERAARAGDLAYEAQALSGMAGVRFDEFSEVPSAARRKQVLELASRALAAARASGSPSMEMKPLWLLGFLEDTDLAIGYLERCFEVASDPGKRSSCRSALALRLARSDPGRAEEAIHQALDLAKESGKIQAQTAAWSHRMRVSWVLKPAERALGDSRVALDAIEALRNQQEGGSGQPGLFSTWAEHYYWFSGRLFEAGQAERAFGVIERMRSRTLIDALGLSRASPGVSPALHARRADIFLEIARVQRRLMSSSLGEKEHDRARAELDRLEVEASARQSQIARADPAFAAIRFASLAQVRGALAPDEALLSFQVAPRNDLAGGFGGGSWLLVSTRDATRIYRMPGRTELRPLVTAFTGMFSARDGSDAPGASLLYKQLLASALAELPPEVRRLVIVPDDFLHRLPFAALRPEPGVHPLATRYEITLAPSATLWLHWREARPAPAVTPALVLADPVTLMTGGDAAGERSAAFLTPVRLGRLPYALTEGKTVKRQLGAELLVGEDASETYIKRNGVSPFGLLHFAAHAITDDVNPDRSGIYLSPGDNREDGVLQVREIAELDLDGRVVVLSTCESASGGILLGEGVMGLARAFFQAGAHTVVASLWPLRDDEGAALFDRFYLHLGQGKRVAAALQASQRDRMEAGAPAAAWAGVVVLGDGERVPVPGGRRSPGLIAGVTLAVILLLAGLLLWRRGAGARLHTP